MEFNEKQQKLIQEIAKKHSLRLLLLFGSQVSGKTHKHSDFDVAYLSYKKLGLMEEGAMIVDLFKVFRSEKVDLANISSASPLLYYAIFENSQKLYESEKNLYNELSVYASKKFIENMPLYELKAQRLKDYLKTVKV